MVRQLARSALNHKFKLHGIVQGRSQALKDTLSTEAKRQFGDRVTFINRAILPHLAAELSPLERSMSVSALPTTSDLKKKQTHSHL